MSKFLKGDINPFKFNPIVDEDKEPGKLPFMAKNIINAFPFEIREYGKERKPGRPSKEGKLPASKRKLESYYPEEKRSRRKPDKKKVEQYDISDDDEEDEVLEIEDDEFDKKVVGQVLKNIPQLNVEQLLSALVNQEKKINLDTLLSGLIDKKLNEKMSAQVHHQNLDKM